MAGSEIMSDDKSTAEVTYNRTKWEYLW